ncbi:MAG: AsmA-like C-terminal region-containing protein [Planctomycetota bacterium]
MKSLTDFLWMLVRWTLPLSVAAVVVAIALGSNRIGEEVRRRIESRLQERFPDLTVRVGAASLVDGEGIVIRGLSFVDPALPAEHRLLLVVDEVRVACGTTLKDLVAGEPRVTAVRVCRPVVHACRGADGRWSLSKLTRGGQGGLPVPVTVDDATLLVDGAGLGTRLTLRNIGIDLRPLADGSGGTGTVIRGTVAADLFDRAGFEGKLSAGGGFELTGHLESLDISPRLQSLLPAAGGAPEWLTGLRGRLNLEWRTSGALDALDAASFAVAGQLESGRFEHAALPFAISDVSAAFTADRSGLSCERLEAHSGSTLVRGSGQFSGWSQDADFDFLVEADRMLVGRHWEGFLPQAIATHWSKLLPAGEVDLRAHIVRRRGAVTPDISLRCRNVSLTYYRFPYRVDRTVGTVTLKDDLLSMHLTGEAGGHPVHVEAAVGTVAGGRGFVEVRGDDMRIDDALLVAMPARSADIVRSLRGSGAFDFVFRHDRSPEFTGGFANSLGIRLTQCSMAYAGFPYPLGDVSGSISMNRGNWTIGEITGSNDTGVVRCTGTLKRIGDDDGELTLNLAGTNVVLERELRDALPSGMRRIWDDVDPRGNAEFTAQVRHRVKARRTEVELEAAPQADTVSIEPTWFPYRLERLRGRLLWKDGRLRFEDVRGAHARTTVSAEGVCRFTPDGGWHVSFERLAADRFRADHDVLQALPAGLEQAVSGVRLRGMLSVDGALEIYSTAPTVVAGSGGRSETIPGPAAAAWDVQLDMEQASLDVGVPLAHVHGGIRLRGQSDGRTWRTVGDIAIDSAMWNGVQMTAVRGPLVMDPMGAVFGSAAGGDPLVATRQLTARVADGTLTVDGSVTAGDAGGFTVTAALAAADLERLAGDMSGGSNHSKGRVHGGIEIRGSRAGTHSLAGQGQVRLSDADIYELPVMMSLLKILRVKAPDRKAFTSSLVDFRIEGPHAYLDTIELSGDAISLVGNGELDFDSNIKLMLRPIMGEAQTQLPAIKRMLGGASGQFVIVRVDGTIADPLTSTEAFPTLAAAVQRLQSQRRGQGALAARRDDQPPR